MKIESNTIINKIKKEIRVNKKYKGYKNNHFLQGLTEGMVIILDWLENKENKELFYEQGDIDVPKINNRLRLRPGERKNG